MKREKLSEISLGGTVGADCLYYGKREADEVMNALEYDIRIYQDIVAKAEARIKELEHKFNQMCWENDSLKDECNKADESFKELESNAETFNAMWEHDKNLRKDIAHDWAKAQDRINELEAANIKCQEHRELIESENATLNKILNERIEMVKELEDELQVANNCLGGSRDYIATLEKIIQELEDKVINEHRIAEGAKNRIKELELANHLLSKT